MGFECTLEYGITDSSISAGRGAIFSGKTLNEVKTL